jgi:hypothetical protein
LLLSSKCGAERTVCAWPHTEEPGV